MKYIFYIDVFLLFGVNNITILYFLFCITFRNTNSNVMDLIINLFAILLIQNLYIY